MLHKDKIAYVDETGIDSYLQREYCYAEKGKKVVDFVSGKKYRRVSIIVAKLGNKIPASMQYEGTMDGVFEAWFEQCLLPSLPNGSTIVMDNADFNRKRRLFDLTQQSGFSLIFLPPYSPNLNSIKNFWALLKQKLRNILPAFSYFDDAIHYAFKVV